jgi:hypothetical protein
MGDTPPSVTCLFLEIAAARSVLGTPAGPPNPQGWQTVAGGRSRDQGRTTTGKPWNASAPRRVCQGRPYVPNRREGGSPGEGSAVYHA